MAARELGFGFYFSITGAVIMGLIYILQITNTAPFPMRQSVTLAIALVALLGALLFYWSQEQGRMKME